MEKDIVKNIYEKLEDDLSKYIFENRMMYSLTEDVKYIHNIVKTVFPYGEGFLKTLERCFSGEEENVIFGIGIWGKDFYQVYRGYPWKCFVDSKPKAEETEGLPVVSFADFIKQYHGENIFILSRLYYSEMYQQLRDNYVPENKIVNVGKMIDELSGKQYFDLEEMPRESKEVFCDLGAFDGLTSLRFAEWAGEGCFVYAFEPDEKNYKMCEKNLRNNNIKHTIFKRGGWSEERDLLFETGRNGATFISDKGTEALPVTTLDNALGNKSVTFIKMDIEGAEAEALKGAKKTICNTRPKLAICVYHKPEDIWELAQIILTYYSGYKLYLRHYSLSNFETVLYAIPV